MINDNSILICIIVNLIINIACNLLPQFFWLDKAVYCKKKKNHDLLELFSSVKST